MREKELIRLVFLCKRNHHHREDAQDRPERDKNLFQGDQLAAHRLLKNESTDSGAVGIEDPPCERPTRIQEKHLEGPDQGD